MAASEEETVTTTTRSLRLARKQSTKRHLDAPFETKAPPVDPQTYNAYRLETDIREPYRIPPKLLENTKRFLGPEVPESPLIAFVNARSGGHAGPKLAVVLYRALGHSQVFDLSEYRPDQILSVMQENLRKAFSRDELSTSVQRGVRDKLRILAAGGDGTVAWVLKTIHSLGMDPPPPVAILPLGTGNDLARTLNWGSTFSKEWIKNQESIYYTLKRIATARVLNLDCWSVRIMGPTKDPSEWFMELPNSLALGAEDGIAEGLAWNYISMGLDAQAAYGFHTLRETKPYLARSRLQNMLWYGICACKTGWFCGARGIALSIRLQIRQTATSAWEEVAVPPETRALVLLNIPSYSGGRDLWGSSETTKGAKFKQPAIDDGLIEVVGLNNGLHIAGVMGGVTHASQIAQAAAVRIELNQPMPGATQEDSGIAYMQLDGEPWAQVIPAGERGGKLVVEVSHATRSRVLESPDKVGKHEKYDEDTFKKLFPHYSRRIRQITSESIGRQKYEQAAGGKDPWLEDAPPAPTETGRSAMRVPDAVAERSVSADPAVHPNNVSLELEMSAKTFEVRELDDDDLHDSGEGTADEPAQVVDAVEASGGGKPPAMSPFMIHNGRQGEAGPSGVMA